MVATTDSGSSDRPIERARATLDHGVRAVKAWWPVKTWWRPVDAPKRPAAVIDLTAEVPDTPQPNGAGDALVAFVTEALDRMRRDIEARDVELLHALQRLAESYERIAERLESDGRERRILSEAVLRLERRLPSAEVRSGSTGELPRGERVTGGWVSPAAAQADSPSPEVAPATIEAVSSR